ncbi:unnamed protein product [Enterobius vermicularis]|uniref:Uncharacterized protein n=1 Tax=Enterobius vermicularis TaxID=51028 RepID=A0A0N4VQF5_ENTVE|nr:unnamed protein product [Enterobius vermicularis]
MGFTPSSSSRCEVSSIQLTKSSNDVEQQGLHLYTGKTAAESAIASVSAASVPPWSSAGAAITAKTDRHTLNVFCSKLCGEAFAVCGPMGGA